MGDSVDGDAGNAGVSDDGPRSFHILDARIREARDGVSTLRLVEGRDEFEDQGFDGGYDGGFDGGFDGDLDGVRYSNGGDPFHSIRVPRL